MSHGDEDPEKMEQIANAAAKFVEEDLSMDNVYNYMYHILHKIAKLQTYKPMKAPTTNLFTLETFQALLPDFVKPVLASGELTEDQKPCNLGRW